MIFLHLLSDADVALSGGAGWVGAGLLGSVLLWLCLKHLPEKDRQVKEIIDSFILADKERRLDQMKILDAQREDHKDFLSAVIAELAELKKPRQT